MAECIISFAEPAGAGLLEQQWQWGVLVEQQNVSAWKSARADVDELPSHSLEVLGNSGQSLCGTGQNFNVIHLGTRVRW